MGTVNIFVYKYLLFVKLKSVIVIETIFPRDIWLKGQQKLQQL